MTSAVTVLPFSIAILSFVVAVSPLTANTTGSAVPASTLSSRAVFCAAAAAASIRRPVALVNSRSVGQSTRSFSVVSWYAVAGLTRALDVAAAFDLIVLFSWLS